MSLQADSVYSMTGFAHSTAELPGVLLALTLRSVNHRYLDLQIRVPSGMESVEASIRSVLKRELVRGHIDCTLSLGSEERPARDAAGPVFDLPRLRAYLAAFRAAAEEQELSCLPDLNTAALVPGLLVSTRADSVPPRAAIEAHLPLLLERALQSLREVRGQEGAALATVMIASLDSLLLLIDRAALLREKAQPAHFERLTGRLRALLSDKIDPQRVIAEAVLLTERGDIEEELARLLTHVEQFRKILQGGGEAGKKLDFLLQEMNRETNTMLSKTAGVTGAGLELTDIGLAMKSEIEKLREQVQNIE